MRQMYVNDKNMNMNDMVNLNSDMGFGLFVVQKHLNDPIYSFRYIR